MPLPIRTLVVADAIADRRCVADTLASEPGIEVVGTAANHRIGAAKLVSLQPDLVTISPDLAENGALELVRSIRQSHPRMPIIVFSSSGATGFGVMQALLSSGASACLSAPAGADRAAVGLSIRETLAPKIRALFTRPVERPERIDVVTIGVSTGGPNALPEVLAALPADFPVPIVIVQHMPPIFTLRLAERLHAKCALSVSEAVAGEALHPGHVWLAPGDYHLIVARDAAGAHFELNQGPQENSCRPAVDPLFRSVAILYGARALGVIMTGMGRDGLKGCQALRAMGGQIIAQDEASSVVWGMPGSVVRAGLADAVLPLASLGGEILRRTQTGRTSRFTAPAHVR